MLISIFCGKEVVVCFGSSKFGINFYSGIISFILIFVISNGFYKTQNISISNSVNKAEVNNVLNIVNNEVKSNNDIKNENIKEKFEWALKIPKIDLYAKIEEGTNAEVLNRNIGHFEETQKKVRKYWSCRS